MYSKIFIELNPQSDMWCACEKAQAGEREVN